MIHQYKNNGYHIVLDVNSGCVHAVDELVYDLLPFFEKEEKEKRIDPEYMYNVVCSAKQTFYTENESGERIQAAEVDFKEAIEEIIALISEDMLFAEDIYEPYIDTFKNRQPVVKALCLHIAHDCNLGCKYCFAEEGEYHGRRALMSFEIGKKALDFLVKESGSRRNLEVDFFGGEPLMNWDVVKQLVEYGRSIEEANNKKFRFTLTTNGMLLNDEILEFANKEMGNLVLSIDGRQEINDFMRPTRNGKGSSYDIIVPKFKKAAESRNQMNYYVRGTYTHYNTDFCEDVLHLADLGFEQISVEPVVAPDSEPYALKE
ncbi:MAG: thioether cross-link-forming SCIFF peptide maturase, partial [Lachnospiraceae bacterium]|nr:thioether cross-link-forming SCIFF peptide maturase [Lachnospiraceae bacterium]